MPSAEPPPLDWRAAALAVGGGDEPDEAFLCELLACFVREGLPHVRGALAAADAHRRALACARATATAAAAGTTCATTTNAAAPLQLQLPPPPPPPDAAARRALAARLFAECHALKGSAANLCLLRLSAAARDVEAVCRPLTETAHAGCDGGGTGETGSAAAASAASAASAAAAAAAAAFDTLCAPPASALRALAAEFRAAARFVQREVAGPRGRAAREPALAAAFSAEGRHDIARAAAADEDFEREVAAPFRALLAGAPEPGDDEGETRGGSGDGAEPSDGAAVLSPPARAAIAPAAAAATLLRAPDAPAATAPALLRAAEAPAAAAGASAPPGAVCCFT